MERINFKNPLKLSNFIRTTTEIENNKLISFILIKNKSEILFDDFTYKISEYFDRFFYIFIKSNWTCFLKILLENSQLEHSELLKVYGFNRIIIKNNLFFIIYKEIYNPFYLFQVFSIILWLIDEYVLYSLTILLITLLSVIYNIYQNYKTNKNLIKLTLMDFQVYCWRNNQFNLIDYSLLVPGDLINIFNLQIIPADCILLDGECIINEGF